MPRPFQEGAVFESSSDGETVYRMPRHAVSSTTPHSVGRRAEEMSDCGSFMGTGTPRFLSWSQVNMPSFMRVIPINATLETQSGVLVYEDAARLVERASSIAVVPCVCRRSQKLCDRPVEICIQLNRGAEYTLKRGTGRRIDRAEALDLLKKAEEGARPHGGKQAGWETPSATAARAVARCCVTRRTRRRRVCSPQPLRRAGGRRCVYAVRRMLRGVPGESRYPGR